MSSLCRMLLRPVYALAVSALVFPACFGTGVSEASALHAAAIQHALAVGDVTVVPPAPANATVSWTNTGASKLEILAIVVPDVARTAFTPTACPGYPTLAAQSSCVLQATAATDAIPGVYPIVVAYRQDGEPATTAFTLTIEPGLLRINDGAAIRMDAQTSAVPVHVVNDGFDVSALDLNVHCPTADGGNAACTMNPNDCVGGLLANAACTALLIFNDPIAGQLGVVDAGGAGAVTCSVALSVGSLNVKTLAVAAPGIYQVVLTNLGTVPVSVSQVQVTAPGIRDIRVPNTGNPYGTCQNFSRTCTIPLQVGPDAMLGDDGLGVVTVTYRDAVTTQTATGVMRLNNATAVQVSHGAPTVLGSKPGSQGVLATNMGPFVWHNAGLGLTPAWPGVTLSSDCATEILVGQDYTATSTSTPAAQEGSSATLYALGKNLAAPAAQPIGVARSMAAVGQDVNNHALVVISTDNGSSWTPHATSTTTGAWHGAHLDAAQWCVVGERQGQVAAAISQDRGLTWQDALFASQSVGVLRAVAQTNGTIAAFGDNGAGTGVMRKSTDGGATFGVAVSDATFSVGSVYAVATNANSWVVVGGDGTDYFIASSADNLATWTAAPPSAGMLYDVAWDGNQWLAVGVDGSGHMLMLHNASASAQANAWSQVTAMTAGQGTLYGVAKVLDRWVVVGDNGSARISILSSDASVPTFAAPRVMSAGSYYGMAAHDALAYAVGFDAVQNTLSIDKLDAGVRVQTAAMPQMRALYSMASR